MNQVIATIYKGYRIHAGEQVFTVVGQMKLRANYFYIVQDVHGRKTSIRRPDLLKGQQDGRFTVTV